jgi:hypothetical protein
MVDWNKAITLAVRIFPKKTKENFSSMLKAQAYPHISMKEQA